MAKHEYHEGPKARDKFDEGMTKLFRAPKLPIKSIAKPAAKPKKTNKE